MCCPRFPCHTVRCGRGCGCLYEERRVDTGRESYDKSKQAVTLVRDAEAREDVQIMSADEVSPAVWSIQICDALKCDAQNRTPLQAKVSNSKGALRNIVFTDYGLAVKFAHWLRIAYNNLPPGSNYTFENYPSETPGSYNNSFDLLGRRQKSALHRMGLPSIDRMRCAAGALVGGSMTVHWNHQFRLSNKGRSRRAPIATKTRVTAPPVLLSSPIA